MVRRSQSDSSNRNDCENTDMNEINTRDTEPLLSATSDESMLMCEQDSPDGCTYTVEEAVEHIGFGRFQMKLLCVCGLFTATDAMEMLLLSVLSPELRCSWHLKDFQVALITTVVFFGMGIGSPLFGRWADTYGRLTVMKIACCWIAFYGLLTAFSPNFYWILFLRGFVGIGFSGAVQGFILLSEYLPMKYRAKILIVYSLTWAVGSMTEMLMSYFIIPWLGWRFLVGLSALPTVLAMFFIWSLPESARYLLAAGRRRSAMSVLKNIARMNKTSLPVGILTDSHTQEKQGRICDLFKKEYARTTILTWLIWLSVACCYYGIILVQSEILQMSGSCPVTSGVKRDSQCGCNRLTAKDYGAMIAATSGEFVVIPINLITIDTFGRQISIGVNFLIAGVCFLLVQLCAGAVLQTIFIFGVRTFINGCFNGVYIFTSEVLMSYSIRMTVCVYGGLCIASALATYLQPIETKGRAMPQSFDIQ